MVDLTGHVHIVGIGGAGMSGIARILVARGAVVSGSDAKESRRLVALRALGIDARVGHDAANVEGADVVVISTAIRATNPEVVGAQERGIPVVSRAEALAAVMAGFRGVAVAGTHGKTTTTSMLTIAAPALRGRPLVRDRQRAQRLRRQRPPGRRRPVHRGGRRVRRIVPAAARAWPGS